MIEVVRQTNSERLEEICNHPQVRPWLGGDGYSYLDLSPLVHNPANVCLLGEFGGVVFVQLQPGLYEAHTQVLPQGRGQWTQDMAKAVLHKMFCETDAVEIVTRVPGGNVAARAGLMALRKTVTVSLEMRREGIWPVGDTFTHCDFYAISIQDWIRSVDGMETAGASFGDKLDAEYLRLYRSKPPKFNDKGHDKAIGIAYEMIKGGQPEKACVFYNRWASMAAYPSIGIMSLDPIVLDLSVCAVKVQNDSFELLRAQ